MPKNKIKNIIKIISKIKLAYKKIIPFLSKEEIILNDSNFKLDNNLIEKRLETIKSFYDEFIGVPIVDFKTYSDKIPDYKNIIQGKLITEIKKDNDKIIIYLSSIKNPSPKYSNKIILQPSLTAEFAEVTTEEKPLQNSLYRIGFMGGDYIEYLDIKYDNNALFCI